MPMMSMKDAFEEAKSLYDQGFYRSGARASEALYKQAPHHPPVISLYLACLMRIQKYEQGIRIAKRSLRNITNKPHRVSIIKQLSDGLTQAGEFDEGIELVRTELESQVDHDSLSASYVHLLVLNNRHEQAIEFIDRMRERGRENLGIAAVFGRAVLRTDRREEAIEWITRLLQESPDVSASIRQQAYNSLGHLLDKAKRFDEAFSAFHKSCEAIKPDYNPNRTEYRNGLLIDGWTSDRLVGIKRPEPVGPRPVFILGMPRSGTTLSEQIIDAHPKAFGAGELGLITELFGELAIDPTNPNATRPDQYDPKKLAEIASIYRKEIAGLAGDDSIEVIVDKAPMNFHYLGMIALAFPDAKIVHCHRDPRDNCLSCYFQMLNYGHSYSYSLENCGHFYRQYRKLMRHYRSLLRSDPLNMPIFENRYEDMVANQEQRTHELLEFIGLDFDPACLSFHTSGRVAVTLSNDQVRQPMYKSSTKRYERYIKHIDGLVKALGDEIDDQ